MLKAGNENMRTLLMKNADDWGTRSHDVSIESSFQDFLFEPLCLLRFFNCLHPRTPKGTGCISYYSENFPKPFKRNYYLTPYAL